MILNMAMENFNGKVVIFIRVHMKTTKDMDMESLHGQMEQFIKENGNLVLNMVLENVGCRMAATKKVFLKIIST